MLEMKDVEQLLGPSPWGSDGRSFGEVEAAWGIQLPPDFKSVGLSYGDALISDFLFICGPETMAEKGEWMSDYVRRGNSRTIPRPVLPDRGGMLLWGHTIEGDRLFLEDRDSGVWTVSAFRRNWGDWYESSLPVIDWLVGVFDGEVAKDWMPEWPDRHWFETD
ncbi:MULTISPECIES: hypothetical protein [unclassified Streptomyces]|uniref:hypothetical protein n=1 Tax=unclassified Streptomyces TaxID=2593676 RepID=UPI0034394D0D|nr:hypothetical protein OG214_33575 [Streptomyces sp. NBC_00872]